MLMLKCNQKECRITIERNEKNEKKNGWVLPEGSNNPTHHPLPFRLRVHPPSRRVPVSHSSPLEPTRPRSSPAFVPARPHTRPHSYLPARAPTSPRAYPPALVPARAHPRPPSYQPVLVTSYLLALVRILLGSFVPACARSTRREGGGSGGGGGGGGAAASTRRGR